VLIQQMRKDRADQLSIILARVDATKPASGGAGSITQDEVRSAARNAANAAVDMTSAAVQSAATASTGQTLNPAAVGTAAANAKANVVAAAQGASTTQSAKPYDNIYQAAADLFAYAQAGSWEHALISLQADTSTTATAATAKVSAAKKGTTAPATVNP
jgi:hypothetical protein